MKKLFLLTTSIIMLICVLTVCASALTYGDLTYTVSNGKVTITDCSTSVTSVTIPSAINGYPVTSIGSSAFRDCTRLTSITIPDSVTSIGSSAFSYCTGLTSVAIPDSVTSIGTFAFSDCTGLTNITIPDSVTSIGYATFFSCKGLTSVTIGDSVTNIGDSAFCYCEGLTSVTIPDSVTSIGEDAFYNCKNLTKINWNAKNVSDFSSDNYVFAYAGQSGKGINVVFGDNVKRIPAYVFDPSSYSSLSYAPKIVSVTIGDSVTSIGSSAFSGCTGLTSITIPDSVTSIGSYAFENCSKLRRISFGSGLQTVGDDAFYGCTSLTKVNIPTINDWCEISFGDREGNPVYYTNDLYVNNILLESDITFPEGITSIGSYTFYDIPYLGDCILPNSLKNIGTGAFGNTISKIDDVYFQGSEDDWYTISIGTGNDALIDNPLYTDYYPSNPQIKYAINSVNVKDISGNSLTNIPETTFIAEIKVTNVASYTTNYILIATYDSDGRMLDIDFLYANPKVGQTVTFGTQIKNENGNVAKIKAFVISDLKSFNAVAEAVELVKV